MYFALFPWISERKKIYLGFYIIFFHLIFTINIILLSSFSFLAIHFTREGTSAVYP